MKIDTEECTIEEPEDGLLDVTVKLHQTCAPSATFCFGQDSLRRTLGDIYKPGAAYTILRTQANPEVFFQMWEQRQELGRRFWPGSYHQKSGYFKPDAMDNYMHALKILAGSTPCVAIPLVSRIDVHNLDRHMFSALFPITHVFRTGNSRRCADLVARLGSDEAFEIIKQREAPHNYNMPVMDYIRDSGKAPVVLFSDPEVIDAAMMRFFINHFAQFVHSCCHHDLMPDD